MLFRQHQVFKRTKENTYSIANAATTFEIEWNNVFVCVCLHILFSFSSFFVNNFMFFPCIAFFIFVGCLYSQCRNRLFCRILFPLFSVFCCCWNKFNLKQQADNKWVTVCSVCVCMCLKFNNTKHPFAHSE